MFQLRVAALTFFSLLMLSAHVGAADSATCCAGDCNLDGKVTIDEVITLVIIGLGNVPPASCKCSPFCEQTFIQCIVTAMANVFLDCAFPAPP